MIDPMTMPGRQKCMIREREEGGGVGIECMERRAERRVNHLVTHYESVLLIDELFYWMSKKSRLRKREAGSGKV